MNYLFCLLGITFVLGMSSCNRNCNPSDAVCHDSPPLDEACQAAFNRWFFDKTQNSCQLVAYSGCSQKGFASQQECEACKCSKK